MELVGSAAVVVAVVALWVAAALFGRDSRDGSDWFARSNLDERPGRLGD